MDKAVLLSMFISFATSNDLLKFDAHSPNLSVQRQQDVKSEWPPKFCNGIDCPMYTVLSKGKGYEERLYNASMWVSTRLKGVDFEAASRPMFMKLFKYISGNNEKKQKIAMTAPVKTRIIPGQGPACESDFIMSFFVSPSVGQPPAPADASVTLDHVKPTTIYVSQFGGYLTKFDQWREEAVKLGAALDKNGLKYSQDHFFLAGYDAPFRLFNRHNEVWFLKA